MDPHIVRAQVEPSQYASQPGLKGAIPFMVLWPILQVVAVPLIRAILPYILEQVANSIRSGESVMLTDGQIKAMIEREEGTMRAYYQ